MKKIIASLFLLFLANSFYGQNKGITYQAVIYSPDAIVLPGQDNMLAPLTNQEVCMRFSFLDKGLTSEYEETLTVVTDGFGMVNLTLGQAAQSGGYASGFEQMTWEGSSKNLMVELDVSGNCFEFVEISNTTLSYVPFAMYAKTSGSSQINATNIDNNTAAIQANTTAIALNTSKVGITAQQIIEITNNTAKTGITSEQATAIAANTAKTGITAEQSDAIAVNTVKVGYTDELVSANTDVVANTAKTGITAEQSDAIAVNTVKVGYTDELVSANTDVVANTAKTGITAEQSVAITANTAKVGMPTATEAGQMNYWNGSAWITIAATVNEGATLQMIGGVPTWVGGAPPPPLQIGDYYQGGIIFYLDGAGGGLIVAVADISPARWGCVGYTPNAGTSGDVGTGATNTTAIINHCPINGIAAQLCDAYSVTVNGVTYSDWFLPSSGELNLMYQNKATITTSALENGGSSFTISETWTEDGITYEYSPYWSSSEYFTYGAYTVDLFDNGNRLLTNKGATKNVRAVRAF
jgi:hypothetical protein